MTPAMRVAHATAFKALNDAKAIKTAFGADTNVWPEGKLTEFNKYMADFATANDAMEGMKKQEASFATLDSGLASFTEASTEAFFTQPVLEKRQATGQTPEKKAEARATHMNAFRRFMAVGASGLTRNEQAAYLSGGRQIFGDNPMEALSGLLPAEQFALVGNVDSLGGFLVPEDFMTEMIAELAGFTVVRPLARVRQTSRQAASFLTVTGSGNSMYSSGVTGAWRGEGWTTDQADLPVQTQPRFGRERVPVHIWCPDVIELTMELMEDSAINLDAEVRRLLAETRGMDEDSAFLLGSGIGSPRGIITEASASAITTVNSGASNAQSWAGLVNLFTSLAAQYRKNATFAFNSYTLGLLLQLEDTEGHLIFPPNVIPSTIMTRPYVVSEFLADGGTNNNLSMIFGDFSYYGIADRMDMRVIRLVEKFAPNVGIMAVARVGGQVLKTAPFRVQKVNA